RLGNAGRDERAGRWRGHSLCPAADGASSAGEGVWVITRPLPRPTLPSRCPASRGASSWSSCSTRHEILRRLLAGGGTMGASAVTNHLIELDQHRGEDAQKATKTRRRLHEVQCDQAALKECQAEFERYLIVVPATTWPEAAARARYLIQLLADAADAQDTRRHELMASVLGDLERLSG